MGTELFAAACGICHDVPNRATMVSDLRATVPNVVKNADYWRAWITNGKPATLMPAFSNKAGGPLNDQQIDSLVQLLEKGIPATSATHTPPGIIPTSPLPAGTKPPAAL